MTHWGRFALVLTVTGLVGAGLGALFPEYYPWPAILIGAIAGVGSHDYIYRRD